MVKRATPLIVALLAALLVMHVGLPHHAGERSGTTSFAAQTHHRQGPSPQVIHIAHTEYTGLPERETAEGQAAPELAATSSAVLAGTVAAWPENDARTRRTATPVPPELAVLSVYRC